MKLLICQQTRERLIERYVGISSDVGKMNGSKITNIALEAKREMTEAGAKGI